MRDARWSSRSWTGGPSGQECRKQDLHEEDEARFALRHLERRGNEGDAVWTQPQVPAARIPRDSIAHGRSTASPFRETARLLGHAHQQGDRTPARR